MRLAYLFIAALAIPNTVFAQGKVPPFPTNQQAASLTAASSRGPIEIIIKVPGDYPTIQQAIDAAVDGYTVLVAPGTYPENIDFSGKAVTVKSEQGPGSTVIQPGGGSVVTFSTNEGSESVLCGFTITGGKAGSGGGIHCLKASPKIVNCSISGNYAQDGGGGIYCEESFPFLMNNLISDNHAGYYGKGGGIYCYRNSNPVVVNNTITDNTTFFGYGAGIAVEDSNPDISNSIIYFNTNIDMWGGSYESSLHVFSGTPILTYCNVAGSWPGTGNIDADPLFADGFHLQQNPCQTGIVNPCVDAGDPTSSMIIGSTRSDGFSDLGLVDMGYHYPRLEALFVPEEYTTIQSAIDAAKKGELVLVSTPGIYVENIDFKGKAITVKSFHGAESTVIDGNSYGSVVSFQGNEGLDSVLAGFTITHGSAANGGGVYCHESSPTLSDNIIKNNLADMNGGGLFCSKASPHIINNVISKNTSYKYGGGIYCNGAAPFITINNVIENTAYKYGGGIFCEDISSVISSNTISYNTAYEGAGGIGCEAASPLIQDNFLAGNQSPSGGGMGCAGSSSIMVHNIFVENMAYSGGGLCADATSLLTITNNVFFNNSATLQGGGIACGTDFSLITNTILWKNMAPAGPQIYGTNPIVTFCDVQGGWPGSGNIDVDPLFVDPQNGDFHIPIDSLCVDHGDNMAPELPETDFEDDPRIAYGIADIGVDEYYLGGKTLHVPEHYPSIQAAIDFACYNDTILVAPGTYVENVKVTGKCITVTSKKGPAATILDGNQFDSTVVFINSNSMISGFTITNGKASEGGGVRCSGYRPSITGNIISNNTAINEGGGIYILGGISTIAGNSILDNTADQCGGGVAVKDAQSTIIGNTILSNTSGLDGGGLYYLWSKNNPDDWIWLFNNIIAGNSSSRFGGGIYCVGYSHNIIVSNTVSGNSAYYGGGICCNTEVFLTSAVVVNTILSGNMAIKGAEACVGFYSDLSIRYSDVVGGKASVFVVQTGTLNWGPGMMDADPLFLDPLNDDYHLTCASPCIDSGSNDHCFIPPTDFEGDPRIFPGNGMGVDPVGSSPKPAITDMGADEYCLLKRQKFIPK